MSTEIKTTIVNIDLKSHSPPPALDCWTRDMWTSLSKEPDLCLFLIPQYPALLRPAN